MSSNAPTGIPALDQPAKPRPAARYPLGLPAGSVRSVLAVSVLAMLWVVLLATKGKSLPDYFIYLLYLMTLIVAHFFAAHGSSISHHHEDPNPLGLPKGFMRFLLTAGLVGLVVWYYLHLDDYDQPPQTSMVMPFVLLAAFIAGWLVTGVMRIAGGGQPPYWFQDIEAWFALIGLFALGLELVLVLFINPSLEDRYKVDLTHLEWVLSAAIGFYFGARS